MTVDWNQMIRRAFGIPDLVGDEVARETILRETEQTTLSTDDVKRIVDTLAKSGVRETVDRLLARDPESTIELTAQSVAAEAFVSSVGGATVAKTKLVRAILERIDWFVGANPFFDAEGRPLHLQAPNTEAN